MKFRVVVQGVPGEPEIQHFDTPIEAEAAYFRLSSIRTDGPGAIKIFVQPGEIIPPAYFRLDRNWSGCREQEPDRMGLWTDTAEGYQLPTPFQLRGIAKALEFSGEAIARQLGITGRLWRYWLAEDSERREIPWMAWRCIRLWLEESARKNEAI